MSQVPLWIASYSGHLNIVNTLIGAGVNVNQGDKVGSHVSSMRAMSARTITYSYHTVKKSEWYALPSNHLEVVGSV